MAAFLIILTVVLALAVAGLVHARRDDGRLTITIETGTIKGIAEAVIEAVREFASQFKTRRVHKALGRDAETKFAFVRSQHHGPALDESSEVRPWKRLAEIGQRHRSAQGRGADVSPVRGDADRG